MFKKITTYSLTLLTALWVAMVSCGLHIEHHCEHCHEHEIECHCGGEHCDHCDHCWEMDLQLAQYDISSILLLPSPDTHLLFCVAIPRTENLLSYFEESSLRQSFAYYDPGIHHGGRAVLSRMHKLSI